MPTCTSAESVISAANAIKADSALIDKFTKGTASETVQLGTGAATPTLRKLVADSQAAVASVVSSSTPIDAAISSSSANPVRSSAIHSALALKADDADVVHADEDMTETEVTAIFADEG